MAYKINKWTITTYTVADLANNPLSQFEYWKHADQPHLTAHVKELYNLNVASFDPNTHTVTVRGTLQGGGHKGKTKSTGNAKQTRITSFTSPNVNPHALLSSVPTPPTTSPTSPSPLTSASKTSLALRAWTAWGYLTKLSLPKSHIGSNCLTPMPVLHNPTPAWSNKRTMMTVVPGLS